MFKFHYQEQKGLSSNLLKFFTYDKWLGW